MEQRITEVLSKYWGFNGFLPLQKEAMECVCRGRDSIVVLPTGGGKSLCFQAPAIVLPGLTLVVSPLLSLMKDQVDALLDNGISAARLDSTVSNAEKVQLYKRLRSRELRLLYVSPERLVMEGFLEFLKAGAHPSTRRTRRLTPRSRRGPTAKHRARFRVVLIIPPAGPALRRRPRLTSNVRPHNPPR